MKTQIGLTFYCPSPRHKKDADQIEKIAKDANDTSTKAYNLLKKTLEGEDKINKDIDELNKKWESQQKWIRLGTLQGCNDTLSKDPNWFTINFLSNQLLVLVLCSDK